MDVKIILEQQKEQQKSCENAKICYICKDKFEDKHAKDKTYKVRGHCHYTGEDET